MLYFKWQMRNKLPLQKQSRMVRISSANHLEMVFQLLLSAKHVFVSNNTVFGERQAPS